MELFNIIVLLVILTETSVLTWRTVVSKSTRLGQKARRRVFVDTSTLMDGRILSVAKTGFLGDEIFIPRSVIRELQLLADGQDSEKRNRARFGLDVVNQLERLECADVNIYQDDLKKTKVDERLIELAKQHNGIIFTNDFNLVKVAATEHVDAININDLAQSIRSEYLPGDHMQVKIISAGSNPRQGVAYLPDGTMIVVDDAEKYAGKQQIVEIEFVRYLQTNAGKMMFAKLVEKVKPERRKIISRKIGRKKQSASKATKTQKTKEAKKK